MIKCRLNMIINLNDVLANWRALCMLIPRQISRCGEWNNWWGWGWGWFALGQSWSQKRLPKSLYCPVQPMNNLQITVFSHQSGVWRSRDHGMKLMGLSQGPNAWLPDRRYKISSETIYLFIYQSFQERFWDISGQLFPPIQPHNCGIFC